MNFDEKRLDEVFRKAIEHNENYLFQLKQTEDKALTDCKLAAKNIRVWVANTLGCEKAALHNQNTLEREEGNLLLYTASSFSLRNLF